jgi:hypothetical protein
MNRLIILVCLVVCISACNNKNHVPSGILSQEQMQGVLWDMLNAQAYTNNFMKKDSSKNIVAENLKFQKEILVMHHVSKDDFYKSFEYYKDRPELLQTVLDSISAKAERDRNLQYKNNLKPSSSAYSSKFFLPK